MKQHELFATVISELSLQGFKDFLEREKAPAPLTEAEEDKLEIKKAEANPDIGEVLSDVKDQDSAFVMPVRSRHNFIFVLKTILS